MNRQRLMLLLVFVALAGTSIIVVTQWKKRFPFGHRSAVFEVMSSALMGYSIDHNGRYPEAENPYQALQLLYPKYVRQDELAGLSGDSEKTMNCLKNGVTLDGAVSSWVYQPGFGNDATQRIAILWDKESLAYGGRKINARVVLFADGSWEDIPNDNWEMFQKQQQALRDTLLGKKSALDTPTNAPNVP